MSGRVVWVFCCGKAGRFGGFFLWLSRGGVGMGWFDSDEGPVWVVVALLWFMAFVVVAQAFRWLLVG